MDILRFAWYNNKQKGAVLMDKVSPERIQLFRTELGYTQEDLADLCGVDASSISR